MSNQTEPYVDFETKEAVCPWCGKRDMILLPMSVDQAIEEMELFQALHEDCERLDKREEEL